MHTLLFFFFFLMIRRPPRSTLFPYTRSSDLCGGGACGITGSADAKCGRLLVEAVGSFSSSLPHLDRKSTRLNSSHTVISYAVFCLKKKKQRKLKTKYGR